MSNIFGTSSSDSLKNNRVEWGIASAYFIIGLAAVLFRGYGLSIAILSALGASLMVFAFANGLISFFLRNKKLSILKLLLCLIIAAALLSPLLLLNG